MGDRNSLSTDQFFLIDLERMREALNRQDTPDLSVGFRPTHKLPKTFI
jgi:hypothetical protein